MKIAILTLPLHTNYGGILQAFALQTKLEEMGHKVEVLDKRRKIKIAIPFIVRLKRFALMFFLRKSIPLLPQESLYKRRKIENKYTWKFADHYIHRREISNFEEIKKTDYDAIIVGSDQVWRPKYFSGNFNTSMKAAFLDFAEGWNIKRISYAASFGVDSWEFLESDMAQCIKLIQKFSYVSVREKSGIGLLNEKLKFKKATCMPDPTFLYDKEYYEKRFRLSELKKSNGNLLVYLIDNSQDKNRVVNYFIQKYQLRPFTVNTPVENSLLSDMVYTQPPVESWLKGFQDAELVVTDSFHAVVFSIIFRVPFVVYGNKERGIERIASLLSIYGLTDRLIEKYDDCINIQKECRFDKVASILLQERTKGISFLEKALSNE